MTVNMKMVKKALLEALEENIGDVSKACKEVGISRTSFYRYRKEDEKFRKELEAMQESHLDFAESKLKQCISDKNITAIMYFLNNKGGKRGYSRNPVQTQDNNRVEIKINGINEKAI